MAAIVARLAADDQEFLENDEPFDGDAGELHARDFGGGGVGVSMLTSIEVHDTPNRAQSGRTGNYPTALSSISGSPLGSTQYSMLFGRGGNNEPASSHQGSVSPQRSPGVAAAKFSRTQSAISGDSSHRRAGSSVSGGGATAAKFSQMKREMVQLRADVINALDALTSQREDASNYIENTSDRYVSSSGDALAALSRFDDRFIYMDKVGHDIPRILQESDLLLKVSFFLNIFGDIGDVAGGRPSSRSLREGSLDQRPFYAANIKTPTPETIATVIAPVLSTDLTSHQASASIPAPTSLGGGGADAAARFLTTIRREVTSKLFPLDDHQIPEMLLTINALINSDLVKAAQEKLAQSDDRFKELTVKIGAKEKTFEHLRAVEDYSGAEATLNDVLSLSAERTDLGGDRVNVLVGSGNGGALAALDRILYNKSIGLLKKEKEAYISDAVNDLQRMEADHQAVHIKGNTDSKKRYEEAVSENKTEIEALVGVQKSIFDEIVAKLAQLDSVAQQVDAKIQEHITLTDVEQKRRQEYREYLDAFARHKTNLNSLIENSRTAVDFLETVRALAQRGKEKIEQSGMRELLGAMTLEERRRYLMAYRHYGDSSHGNMARLDKKLANATHIQEDMRSFVASSAAQDAASAPNSRPATTSRGDSSKKGDAKGTSYSHRIAELEATKVVVGASLVAACEAYESREDRFVDLMSAVHHMLGRDKPHTAPHDGDTESTVSGTNAVHTDEEHEGGLSTREARLLDNTDEGDLVVLLRRKRVDMFQDHVFRLEGVAKETVEAQEEIRQRHASTTEHSMRLQEISRERRRKRGATSS